MHIYPIWVYNEVGDKMKKERSLETKKNLKNRLNRIQGQIQGISKMIDDNRYCIDIIYQLEAIKNAIKSLETLILDEHVHTCLIKAIEEGNIEIVDELMGVFKKVR